MPGIAGTVTHGGIDRSQDTVREWNPRPGPGMETGAGAGVALAHEVSPNSLNPPRVARSRDGGVLAVIDGFLCSPDRSHASEVVLQSYERKGEDFLDDLRGSYALAIWDSRKALLILATDGTGLRHLYYTHSPDCTAFATDIRTLLALGVPPGSVDEAGISDFLLFGFPTDTRTFFTGIKVLEAGSALAVWNGKANIRNHRHLEFGPAWQAGLTMKDRADAVTEGFLQGVKEMTAGASRVEVPLSGGLDSRCIVAALHYLDIPMRTYTIGSAGSQDVSIATTLAERLEVPHTVWTLQAEDSLVWARDGIRFTAGMLPAFDTHILHVADRLPADSHLVLEGMSSLDGFFSRLSHSFHCLPGRKSPRVRLIRKICSTPLFSEQGDLIAGALFSSGFRPSVRSRLADSLIGLLESIPPEITESLDILAYLDWTHRLRQFNSFGAHLLRTRCETLQPFFHPLLLEVVRGLPPRLRGADKPLVGEMLHRMAPTLSDVPYERTGLPPRAGVSRQFLARATRAARMRLARALPWCRPATRGIAIDYDLWLRTSPDLQAFVREVLLCPRCLDRGYYNPKSLIRLVEDQLAGRTRSLDLISRLISLELWHRYFLEGDMPGEPRNRRVLDAVDV